MKNQKKKAIQNEDINNQNSIISSYDTLIEEVEIMQKKIKSNEINIENIKFHQLDKEMINSLKQLFDNLIYIYSKHKLHTYFREYKNKITIDRIADFLSDNLDKIIHGVFLFKINFKTKGYKTHFYRINKKEYTLNIYKSEKEKRPDKIINLLDEVKKVEYGIKSFNFKKYYYLKKKMKMFFILCKSHGNLYQLLLIQEI